MCGVVGLIGRPQAGHWASRGLYALQHRGHDSCGLASITDDQLQIHSGKGAVADVLSNSVTAEIETTSCIAQNLYTTYGNSHSTQPFGGRFWDADGNRHQAAVVHNGQLCGIDRLRRAYPSMYSSHSDSEIIFALLPHMEGKSILERVQKLLPNLEGAFSIIILSEEGLIAARDPNGFRPLVMGRDDKGAVGFSSELNAFDIMELNYERDIEPGEIVHISPEGEINSFRFTEKKKHLSQCVFEHIYFARPDNQLFGKPGYSTQQELGKQTALELKDKLDVDVVVPVPDSATIASLSFARTLDVPLEMGILRHHFASRTFITRGQENREKAVRQKFNIVKDVVQRKKILLVDDSLVRSTTSRILINMLRKAGAAEVHLALFSPHITWSCIYGINTPTREELLAFQHDRDDRMIAKSIGADSVNYLSMDGLRQAMNPNPDDYCYACMDGNYPIENRGEGMENRS
jgi:amidophosphoribosyltransferase